MANLWKNLLMVSLIIVSLLIFSCTNIDERFKLATDCQATEENDQCDLLWKKWNRAIEAKERRIKLNTNPCGQGYILYCDQWCSRSDGQGVCVKQNSIFIW